MQLQVSVARAWVGMPLHSLPVAEVCGAIAVLSKSHPVSRGKNTVPGRDPHKELKGCKRSGSARGACVQRRDEERASSEGDESLICV